MTLILIFWGQEIYSMMSIKNKTVSSTTTKTSTVTAKDSLEMR